MGRNVLQKFCTKTQNLKEPTKAIDLINEYANGGFYYIMKIMQDQPVTNDLEWVKQEIFGREVNL